jgi:ABC-type lipoprotein export system ATPase subunit
VSVAANPTAAAPVVDTRDLFRVHRTAEGDAAALQGLTLAVQPGEVVAVLGPSGAGKSSLLRVLAGLDPPSAGVARVLGQDLGRLPGRKRTALRRAHLGLVDQHYDRALPPALPGAEVVALPLALRGEPARARRRRAAELLERVGLGDRGAARPHELSGGERQRLAVAAALAHRPGLLLADEPAGELDAAAAAVVYELIAELSRETGAAAIVVSHDPTVRGIADRTVRLRDGRISDEAAGAGAETIVVGRGGWLRLPEELLRDAGLGDRLRARGEEGRVVLEPADGEGPAAAVPPAQATPPSPAQATRPAEAGPPAEAAPPIAELRAVDKAYGDGPAARAVLAGATVAFAPGRLTALTGRSGSGKSTALRLLAALELPDAGEIVSAGVPLAGLDRAARAEHRRAAVAWVGQDPGLADHLSALENVQLALALQGVEDEERAAGWLAEVGLAERVRQRAGRLSAGERQRVAIARALATSRPLLLVDEPTSRLDEANAAAVGELLATAAREHGVGVVCATHEPVLVRAAEREVRMADLAPAQPRALGSTSRP